MTRSGFHIIDCHHHVGKLEALGISLDGAYEMSPAEYEQTELEVRLGIMEFTGVDQAVVIPGHGYIRPGGIKDTRRINDGIASYRDAHPERFPAALGIVEPIHGEAGLEELTRITDELGLVGVSFHVRFQGVSMDSPLVLRLVERMCTLGLVPFVHAITGVPDEALWRVQQVARRVPDAAVVVLDAFSSSEQGRQALAIAEDTPNLVFDTSLAGGFDQIHEMVLRIGAERVVFGTDVYSQTRRRPPRRNHVLDQLLDSDLTDGDKHSILSGNIVRLLGMQGESTGPPPAGEEV